MDRLDRTLTQFVDDGRLSSEIAEDLSREYHIHPVDVRQRLAEFAGYVGVALATLGLVLIGSQIWSDFGQVARALLPAVLAGSLLLGTYFVVHAVPDIAEHPVRGRIAQVMGVSAAVLAILACIVAFEQPMDQYGDGFRWQAFIGSAVGLSVALLVSRWSPGFIATGAVGILAFVTGMSFLDGVGLMQDQPVWVGAWLVVLGATAALVLYRFFPPDWLTRAMGVGGWLLGVQILLTSNQLDRVDESYWVQTGRLAAVLLVVLGTWLFVRGGDWPWAAGAAIAMAQLVGMWSAEAVNAGVALVVAGVVLIGVGLGLAAWRQGAHRSPGITAPGAASHLNE